MGIYTPPENKHSCRPVEKLMGDDDPKHIICFPLETPKKMWMVHNLPKIFAELRRGLVFYPKNWANWDLIGYSLQQPHWKSNSVAGQPRMGANSMAQKKRGWCNKGEKT